MNLHHFLGAWASSDLGILSERKPVGEGERGVLATLDTDDQDRWNAALRHYDAQSFSPSRRGEDLSILVEEARRAAGSSDRSNDLTSSSVLIGILQGVMDLYCERWWPLHDQANREWIGGVAPMMERHEERFIAVTSRLYASEWIDGQQRVDVSAYAPFLGYTTERGAIAIHSSDELNAGFHGLEIVFHEVQHQEWFMPEFARTLEAATAQGGGAFPAELGHALIYATAGEITRGIALAEGESDFTPLWKRQDFQVAPMWGDLAPAVEAHWLPAVREEQSVDAAIQAILRVFVRTD